MSPTASFDEPASPVLTVDEPIPHVRIRPASGWSLLNLGEVWRYRELLWFFTLRDIKARYKQTLLGPIWIILMPLATSGLFSLIFGVLAGLPSGEIPYPVFVFSGTLVWGLFAKALSTSSACLKANQNLITKVYFPRLIIPLAASVSGLLDFLLGVGTLAVLMLVTGIAPSWSLLALPAFVLLAILAGLSVGVWISALSVRFRDIGYAATFLISFWMWLTPVAYSSEVVFDNPKVPAGFQPVLEAVYQLNPMFLVVEGFRWAAFGERVAGPTPLSWVSLAGLLFILGTGLFYFRRTEVTFADVV